MRDGAETNGGLRRKVTWLIGLRAVAVTALLGAAVLLPGNEGARPRPSDAILALGALTYLLTALYAATLRYVERWRWLVDVHANSPLSHLLAATMAGRRAGVKGRLSRSAGHVLTFGQCCAETDL